MDEALIKKVMPHSIDAEKSVIGSMLMDQDAITAASEIMAILCLSRDLQDLKTRISRIIVGYNKEGFIIRNSWGTSYGNNGYSILKYKDFNKVIECWF